MNAAMAVCHPTNAQHSARAARRWTLVGWWLVFDASLALGEPTAAAVSTADAASTNGDEHVGEATSSALSAPTQWTTTDQPLFVPLRNGTSVTIGPHSTVTRRAMTQVALGI